MKIETEVIDGCQVEWQKHRGVLYVHGPDGRTLLRVCRLAGGIGTARVGTLKDGMIDLNAAHPEGNSYPPLVPQRGGYETVDGQLCDGNGRVFPEGE